MKPVLQATSLALALLLATGAKAAKSVPAQRPEARAAELAAAQADLQRAAQRVAELTRGTDAEVRAQERVAARMARRPILGVVLAPDSSGVRIAGVTPDSAAAKAGLRGGDRLVAVDGSAISGADADARLATARALLGKLETGKPVRLGYVRDGRSATVAATPQLGDRLRLWTIEGTTPGAPLALGVDPHVRTEVLRLQGPDPCEGDNCRLPFLAEAFRWNGLNLAAVDSRLGRYFGTTSGVLVLSTGDSLAGLQPGDVLRRIGGTAVATPRDAMKALQAHPAGTRVSVDYLRDHKAASTQVAVPKPFEWPLPPAPPAPPRPPAAPRAPAAPPAAPSADVDRIQPPGVLATLAPPPPPPAPPSPPAPLASRGGTALL